MHHGGVGCSVGGFIHTLDHGGHHGPVSLKAGALGDRGPYGDSPLQAQTVPFVVVDTRHPAEHVLEALSESEIQ